MSRSEYVDMVRKLDQLRAERDQKQRELDEAEGQYYALAKRLETESVEWEDKVLQQ